MFFKEKLLFEGVSKLLDTGPDGSDWRGLAEYLGYNSYKVDQFQMSLQPSVMMLTDWMTSSKNTSLSLEMIIAGLEQLGRHDVISVIREEEQVTEWPQVKRKEIFHRKRLETFSFGFPFGQG